MTLKEYLERNKLSTNKFAAISGIPQSTIWRIANGKSVPTPHIAKKIEETTSGKVTLLELLFPHKHDGVHSRAKSTKIR